MKSVIAQAHEAVPPNKSWSTRRDQKNARLAKASSFAKGRVIATSKIVQALETLVHPGDRVALEGNNQKQADFLSRSLAKV
ncbi:MAG TPA: malonate decarboxylase subunit alpha, partial [Chthoniobacterales bacterium]|nr:malonate decarboxylase subunit alpha [Chthoniobacterales bacterium]